VDARAKNTYQRPYAKHESSLTIMSKSEQALQREQRLAAKLRENLKRRKGQAKARADSERQAPDPSGPQSETVNKP
jgi:Spy/CpxP family protein refolding chaperone